MAEPARPAPTGPWTAWRQDVALYRRLMSARLRAQMQYRASFLMMTLVSLLATGTELLAILILFQQFGQLAGWQVGEVALLYGLSAVAFGLNEMVGHGFDTFPTLIRRGEFDLVLMRPAGTVVQILAGDIQLRRLGRVAQGVVALGLALAWTPIAWTPAKLLVIPVVLVCGAMMYLALTVLGAVLCFWTVQSIELINVLTYGGTTLTSYPLPIYHPALQRFFIFIIPLAFVSYFPALYLLDRSDPLGLPGWLPLATPLATAGLTLLAALAWRFGIRHYQSTGT